MGSIPFAPPVLYGHRPNQSIRDLILMSGQERARAAERSGDIWMNAMSNIGQQLAGGVMGYAQAKDEQRKQTEMRKQEEAMMGTITSFDPADPEGPKKLFSQLVSIQGPKEGARTAEAVLSFHKQTQNNPPEELGGLARGLDWISKQSDTVAAQAWPLLRQRYAKSAAQAGLQDPGEEWSPAIREQIVPIAGVLGAISGKLKEEAGPTVGSFEDYVSRKFGATPTAEQVIQARSEYQQAGTKPEKGPAVGSFEDYIGRKYGPNPTPDQIEQGRKAYAAADNAAKSATTLTPTAESNIVNRLSNQWTKAATTAKELQRNVTLMDAGLAAARRGDLAAGSQAVLVTFQKILDPKSVVRESEYARSAEGQSLLSRIEGSYEKLVQGGAGVPLSQLEKYAALAKEMAKATGGNLEATKKRLSATAKRYNIPEELIVEDYGAAPVAEVAPPPLPSSGPQIGERRIINGQVGVWNGKGWVAAK